jgi:hypothetical protein
MALRIRIASRSSTPLLHVALTAVAALDIGKSVEQISCKMCLGALYNFRLKKQWNLILCVFCNSSIQKHFAGRSKVSA